MSKIVCDICGTTYDDSTGACPVCGWNPGTPLDNTYSAEDAGDLDLDYPLDALRFTPMPEKYRRASRGIKPRSPILYSFLLEM